MAVLTYSRLSQQPRCRDTTRTDGRPALIADQGMVRSVWLVTDRTFDLAIGAERLVTLPTDLTRVLFAERLAT